MPLREMIIRNFDKGLVTQLEPQSIPEQAASSSLNWLTLGDKIELSGGYTIVGTENAGSGKITGLHVAVKADASLLPIRTRGKKIEYYTAADWTESGTDQLGTSADGEDIAITSYTSLAGYQAWLSSPNSGYFKMMLANPGSIKDLFLTAKNFKGYITAGDNSIYLWYRANNTNYLYRSYKDLQNTTVYTTIASQTTVGNPSSITIASPCEVTLSTHGLVVDNAISFSTTGTLPTGITAGTIYYVIASGLTADLFRFSLSIGGAAVNTTGTQSGTPTVYKAGEVVGNSGSTTYSGTLVAVTGLRTCFNVVFTDGTQTLTDNKNGGFTGGGTGTINYATGVYSVTFTSTTTGAVSVGYSHETSTVKGVADFTFTATRLASEGFFLPQPTGGDLLNVLSYQTDFYCIHERNAWLFTLNADDVTVSNKEWRLHIGMANWRGAVSTADGIYYIDVKDPIKPQFKLLTLQSSESGIGTEVVPISVSSSLDLSAYDFSKSVGFQWGNYILFQGKQNGSSVNDRLFAYNLIWKSFDVLDYNASCFANYDDELWAGDILSNNVMKLFSTTSANGALINNHWIGKLSQLQIGELKKHKRLTLKGAIGTTQNIKVSLSFDRASFVEIGRILGTGSYVDFTSVATIGSSVVGSAEVGGGSDGSPKFNYVREFHSELLNVMTRFDEVQIKIEATNVGYASVTEINYYDIKTYGQKNLLRYRTT